MSQRIVAEALWRVTVWGAKDKAGQGPARPARRNRRPVGGGW